MPTLSLCEREIRDLHDFFARWYCGRADPDEFRTVERALAPTFEILAPDGTVTDRDGILSHIRSEGGSYEPGEFDIDVRNVEPVDVRDDRALVRYEECQERPDGANGRISTALFGPARSPVADQQDVEWLYLHETWLDR